MVSSSILKMSDLKSIARVRVYFSMFLSAIYLFITMRWYSIMGHSMEIVFLSAFLAALIVWYICGKALYALEKNQRVYLIPFFIFLLFEFGYMLIQTSSLFSQILVLTAIDYDSIKWSRDYHINFFAAEGLTLMYFYFIKVFSSLFVEMGKPVLLVASLSPNFNYYI